MSNPLMHPQIYTEVLRLTAGIQDSKTKYDAIDSLHAFARFVLTCAPPEEKENYGLHDGLRNEPRAPGMALPPLEEVSARVHAAWVASKLAQDITSRKAEDGEELIAPYDQLSEKAKDLDRGTVRAVYAAIGAHSSPQKPTNNSERDE